MKRHDRMGDLLLQFQLAAYRGEGLTTAQMREYGGDRWGEVYVRLQRLGYGFRGTASKFRGGRPWKYTLVTEPAPKEPATSPVEPEDVQDVLFDAPASEPEQHPISAVFGDPNLTGRR